MNNYELKWRTCFDRELFFKRSTMRTYLIVGLILYSALLMAGNGYSQQINLNADHTPFETVIKELRKQSGFDFIYSPTMLQDASDVTLKLENVEFTDALNAVFKAQPLQFVINGKTVVIQPREVKKLVLQSQRVNGVVTDRNQVPLQGVTVGLKGTAIATQTNARGRFSIKLADDHTILVFSMLGYDQQEITVKPGGSLTIALSESMDDLDEVVVVGYGTQAKRDLTGAITSISADDMESNPGATINSALQGKIPGMQIVTTSGEPGAGSSIKIRGASSINGGSEPLYIIDGVPMESDNISSIDGDASFSPIASLNPNDIESVEVLKDAASGAIYGSRAANGVVIITTKGGNKFGAISPRITYDHTSSLVKISRKLDVMNGDQFRTAYVEARANNGQEATQLWVTNPYHPYYNRTTDWQDVIFRTAYQNRNDLSLRGSSDKFAYGISLGYRNLQPVIVNTGYKQLNMRGNFTYRLSKRISAGTNISYTDIDYNRILSSSSNNYSALRAALFTNPVFSPYDPLSGDLTDWLGQREMRNPLAMAQKVPIGFFRKMITLNQYISAELMKGLTLRTSLYANIATIKQSSFQPKTFDSATPRRDFGKFSQNEANKLVNENTLTYDRKFGKHRIGAVVGQSIERDFSESIRLDGENYIDSKVTPIQNAARFSTISRTESERIMLSFFGRANYNYDSRYLLSFTMRADGSSRFGSDKRFGYFPSASAGWRFSDEHFMDFSKGVLTDGKVRASVGVTGNQSISNYAWQGAFSASSNRYDGNVIIDHNSLMNTNLGWETTTQYNVGLDLMFYKGRINLTADAYHKSSKDLLFNFPINYYTGFASVATNFGNIENRGLEFLIETVNIDKKVRWETGFNISFNRNKITDLPQGDDILIDGYSLGRIGEPIGIFYAHQALGVYDRDESNVYHAPDGTTGQYRKGAATGEVFKGGDMIWADLDDNGVIDDYDRLIIGDPNPKFIAGLNNKVSYKEFSLNVNFYWSKGNMIMNELRRRRNQMTFTGNLGQDALNRWREQGDITQFPMVRYGDAMENFRPSTFNLEDGSFIRLKEVTLSYSIPANYLEGWFVNSASAYVSGTNLLTWSRYSGYDPEVNSSTNPFVQGVDNGSFPKSRSFNLGIRVQF